MASIEQSEKLIEALEEGGWKTRSYPGRTSHEIAIEIGMNERMVQAILDDLGL